MTRTDDQGPPHSTSRRELLKAGAFATAGLAMGVTPGCRSSRAGDGESSPAGNGPEITIAGYPFDRIAALADGKVGVEGCRARFERAGIFDLNAMAMGGDQRWEVQEIGLHPFMLAWANDGFRDYTLIPVFPLRTFRHKSIFVHADAGIRSPEDLRGRRVAVAGYSQSSLVWIRGVLEHEYGVRPADLEWVLAVKASEGDISGNESRVPEGVTATPGPAGKDESQLLMERVVDAVFAAKEPQAYIDGDPKCIRLFGDYRQTEQAYYRKTDIFPIMHTVAIRRDVVEKMPDLPRAVFEAYSNAKAAMYAHLRDMGWAMSSLPWFGQELEETRELMGENFWPYGVEPNRKALDALFRYSHEQGFSERRLTIEELFHPSTLDLVDAG